MPAHTSPPPAPRPPAQPAVDDGTGAPAVEDSQPVARQFTPPALGETITVDGKYYFIGNFIGKGSFGDVYECTDEWSNELVAKILVPKNQTYDEVKESWLAELHKLMELRHPNVTFIHQAFEYKDTFYLVIERCSMTLDAIINDPKLNHELWVPYVARDVLQALDYFHLLGYVHKDIHAGNVFVAQSFDRMVPTKDPVWSFKIGDLGISRLAADIRIFNTLLAQWMVPPEALDPNEFGPVSRATDIYHTALLLLALLVGRTPSFTQDEVRAGAPRQLAESLNSKYAPAVAKALRRHTSARTPTAMQFWRELSSLTQDAT
ncbi:MAG: serine/threonine-protein kinase [Candidatus Accumulibacter sp.]|uniref:Serine/threonine-protein kinase n=1 Tax=Candidatus Accumulibacter affinis TaxID=2954384 RepID=A0A935T822_9PROT|nr:serine/threonine-protein kinase [Candidatus Accumulibacter affinis]